MTGAGGSCLATARLAAAALVACLTLVIAPLGLAASGCRGTTAAAATALGPADPIRVSATPAYLLAQRLYARRDYTGAAAQIRSLLAEPRFMPRAAPEAHTFLVRQLALCQAPSDRQNPRLAQILQRAAGLPGSPSHDATPVLPGVLPQAPARTHTPIAAGADCGPRALLLVCQAEGIPAIRANLATLRRLAGTNPAKGGTNFEGLARAARAVGFPSAEGIQVDRDALANLSGPAIAWVGGNHYIAVLAVRRSLLGAEHDTARIHDPNSPKEEVIPLADLLARSGGVLLALKPA